MSSFEKYNEYINKINPKLLAFVLKASNKIPYVRRLKKELLTKEFRTVSGELESMLKPYKKNTASYREIPRKGIDREEILTEIKKLKSQEESKWKSGRVSGAVYHGNQEHVEFLDEIYALNSQSNPLHFDVWPSATKYESEIVAMTAHMLGSGATAITDRADDGICGTVTSGGTESILLAMKAYRDWAREERGIRNPEIVAPTTIHPAFEKASQYFNMKLIRVPVDKNFKADVKAIKKALCWKTAVIAGSAPSFPHGIIDPIEELSALAESKRIGFHTDACLGGFLLPWLEKLGYDIPRFDFRLPGVTSISADTHKYGYAAKGTSVVLYRGAELLSYQFYKTATWPGGLYFSPTLAGSRPGALSAACWAAMISLGEEGYIEAAKKIIETANKIKKGIEQIPKLHILGDPLWVIAFGSEALNIYQVMEYMTGQGWSLNGLHKPPSVHLCVTLRHTLPQVADKFIEDLNQAVRHVEEHPEEKGLMAPIYGLAASIPDKRWVADMLNLYMRLIYKV